MTGLTGNNILAGSSGQGGYEIDQSLRFEDGDSAYLEKTFSSAGTGSGSRWTFSCFVKRGNIGTEQILIGAGVSSSGRAVVYFNSSDQLVLQIIDTGITRSHLVTTQVFRDVGAWYHIVAVQAEPDATSTDRVRLYVNGSRLTDFGTETYSSGSAGSYIPNAWTHRIGSLPYSVSSLFDGYLAEIHLIAGQSLDPSYFGETNPLTNQWIPKKYVGTYGTNGFYLNFSDSASLGADSSGNGNDFTPTNLAATDQVLDSPTNNFATLNSAIKQSRSGATFKEGNLQITEANVGWMVTPSTMGVKSGKWYWETVGANPSIASEISHDSFNGDITAYYSNGYIVYYLTGDILMDNGYIWTGIEEPSSATDVIGVALNADASPPTVSFYRNNVLLNSAVNLSSNFYPDRYLVPAVQSWNQTSKINFGQDSSFAGAKTAQGNTDANGKGDFYYAPPSGYLALCEDNLPDPSIALPGDHFNTVLYTGNGSTQSITGVGFQPDFTWLKHRNSPTAYSHQLYDVVRGATKYLVSNTTGAEVTDATTLTSFDSDGFSLGSNVGINQNTINHVSWNWKADNTSGSSNTDGTITSTVSANPTAGFSIVSYTGNGSAGATIGHGLSVKPEIVIIKRRSFTGEWAVGSDELTSWAYSMSLDTTAAESSIPTRFNSTAPTSSVFSIGTSPYTNVNTATFIAYCFHSVEGYSKIGSYTGNGSTDGPFVYTGFRPAFVITKAYGSTSSWQMFDTKRSPHNQMDKRLRADTSGAEDTNLERDFLSNGFKIRTSNATLNGSGVQLIYMAFAESPFKYSTAR